MIGDWNCDYANDHVEQWSKFFVDDKSIRALQQEDKLEDWDDKTNYFGNEAPSNWYFEKTRLLPDTFGFGAGESWNNCKDVKPGDTKGWHGVTAHGIRFLVLSS